MTGADAAIAALAEASADGRRLARLPNGAAPATAAQAQAAQAALVAGSGQTVAGWKVARAPSGEVIWGAIYARDLYPGPAVVPAGRYPLRGVEAEIAYRFRAPLPHGDDTVTAERLAALVEPLPAFEIVDSRFESYADAPFLDRLVDRMSNGGLVIGRWSAPVPTDFAAITVRLDCNGATVFQGAGGLAAGHPFTPLADFVARRHPEHSFAAGEIVTTGTFTGLRFGKPGERYRADFGGAADLSLTFA